MASPQALAQSRCRLSASDDDTKLDCRDGIKAACLAMLAGWGKRPMVF
jgi:hypothetical protein